MSVCASKIVYFLSNPALSNLNEFEEATIFNFHNN